MLCVPMICGDTDVKYCFGMCRQNVVDEKKNYSRLLRLSEVEFFEFLVRLAALKYAHMEVPVFVKLEALLDELLKLIHAKRIHVKKEVEEQSESDDDY